MVGRGGGGYRSSSSSSSGSSSSSSSSSAAATAPVKKQLIFRKGWLDFLFMKRTFFCKKRFRDLRVPFIS